MTLNMRQVGISLLYVAIMSWIYLTEIVSHWSYMGFRGTFTASGLAVSVVITVATSAMLSQTRDTRAATLACMHYLFFLPAIILLAYSSAPAEHYVAFLIVWGSLTFFSALQFKPPIITTLEPKNILIIVFGAILFALISQAAYGGMATFNLDIERVYEFRREAASNLPTIFGYVYSNVASVLVPLALVLSYKFRAYWLMAIAFACSVMLFGMTHHKSVLFTPPAVALLYILFLRMRSPHMIGIVFLVIPLLCATELIYLRLFVDSSDSGYINSLLARRVLFVPSLLDSLYINYFNDNGKYFWSASHIFSWAIDNPFGVSAPFLIGSEYFYDNDMSANAGVIGSGYSNAGLLGVAVYAAASGALLALLNAHGRRIGHALVTGVSLTTTFNILTTTDLLTAILTHGLLLLLALLAVFPAPGVRRPAPARRVA
ncbi:MAG: hypothetical protein Q8P61_03460 [Candidatus Nanopelagicales bacterium]|nr:hypothetical protein [Candidatus Nanopelagicales bacterium]